jgi:apolipoprotein N-acyltransferase
VSADVPAAGLVICRPQAERIIETTNTTTLAERRLLRLGRLAEYGAAILCGLLLPLSFPKAGITWLVPFALLPLWWAWSNRTPAAAARVGYIAGLVYFSVMFSWFGETAGALVGPFAFTLVLVPAAVEALAFAACGALSAYANLRVRPELRPLAYAAAFTLCEWARSNGLLGIPFAQLGVSQADGLLAPLGAYVGAYGITFVLCALSGYFYLLVVDRRAWRTTACALASIAVATFAAWWWWPARTVAPPTIPVAAIQGNVKQGLKWSPASVWLAIDRYIDATRAAGAAHPRLVVWPETVIAEELSNDPVLRAKFSYLARSIGAPIVVGSIDALDRNTYFNSLFIFTPDGKMNVYHKHQLVPFAEFLPAASILGKVPGAQFISRFTPGPYVRTESAGGLIFGPLICWESAFADLAYAEVREGAQFLVVATDDGWFGETSGPFQHAQIAQMRAIETGRWVVRAAATGISEIIAPNGRPTIRAPLDVQMTILGKVGLPQPTLFSVIGPNTIALGLALLLLGLLVAPRELQRG